MGLAGDYYYVGFLSTEPNTQIVVTSSSLSHGLLVLGLIALSGIGLIIVGIIVAIVGVILKNPRKDPRAVI
jgi:hypothetical protein